MIQQYIDLLQALRKEAMSNMIKASIRQQFPEPLASQYCQKFDDFKMVVDLLEYKRLSKMEGKVRGNMPTFSISHEQSKLA